MSPLSCLGFAAPGGAFPAGIADGAAEGTVLGVKCPLFPAHPPLPSLPSNKMHTNQCQTHPSLPPPLAGRSLQPCLCRAEQIPWALLPHWNIFPKAEPAPAAQSLGMQGSGLALELPRWEIQKIPEIH